MESVRQPRPGRGPAFILTTLGFGVFALVATAMDGFAGFVSTVAGGAFLVAAVAVYRGGLAAFYLPTRLRAGLALGASAFVLIATAGVAAPRDDAPRIAPVAETSASTQRSAPSPTPTGSTGTEYRTQRATTREAIPFGSVTIEDAGMPEGTSVVTVAGVDGVLENVYRDTFRDDRRISRELVAQVVVTAPIDQVTAVGTYRPPATRSGGGSCDPNYTGCVPIASDVDCAGGSGNGPAYADGPVTVIGRDIYDLDRNGDGIACE